MSTLVNREDPDEMPHNAAFHLIRNCLPKLKYSSVKKVQFYLEIIIYGPLIYIMNHPKFTVSYQEEEPIRIQRVNRIYMSSKHG